MVSLLLGASCSCRAEKPKRPMNDDPLPKDEDDDDDDDDDDGYFSPLCFLSSSLTALRRSDAGV